jgi:hypothetical protein
MNLPYNRARDYAEKIVSELSPYCSRIEIAGSIRRKRREAKAAGWRRVCGEDYCPSCVESGL